MSSSAGGHSRPISIVDALLNPESSSLTSRKVVSDSRFHGYNGPTRSVTLHNISSPGSGAISASQDGERCVVAGRDSLRILRISSTDEKPASELKHAVGQGGSRIVASKNMFASSSSKVDGSLTDVVWCQGTFENKIITSARNGEFVLWDLQKSGSLKLERRLKYHTRAVNKLSYNGTIPYCCTTSSSDGYLRLWDLRDLQRTAVYIHHPAPVRSSVFAPFRNDPFRAITGLDNGNISRWDLRMGPKGLLDWIPLAHTGSILSLDWCNTEDSGWLASAGFDRTVKVWEYPVSGEVGQASAANQSHGSKHPSYTLHASFPVRRVVWRPGHETELAIASNNETTFSNFSSSSSTGSSHGKEGSEGASASSSSPTSSGFMDSTRSNASACGSDIVPTSSSDSRSGDTVEVWDVRRSWLAKWTIHNNNQEGGVTDFSFADSHTLWVQHPSGAFSQMDMRFCDKPIDSLPRNAVTWNLTGSLSFAAEQVSTTEIPYDDIEANDEPESQPNNKRLGNDPYKPSSQTVGTLFFVSQVDDWESFAKLAQGYRLDGDRAEACGANAEVAFSAGDENTGRVWVVLQDLLTDVVVSKLASHKPPLLSHSASAPAGVPSIKKSPPQRAPPRSSSSEHPRRPSVSQKGASSPSPRPPQSPLASKLQVNDTSPESNPASSPNRAKVRNQSVSAAYPPGRTRRNSLRRISLSSMPLQDVEQSNISRAKPRRSVPIGEGALDDSSSDESTRNRNFEGSGCHVVKERRSSSMSSYHGQRGAVSSPLARDDNWLEDEHEDSASPRSSSDADSDVSNASTKPVRGVSANKQTRRRSSTLASVAPSLRTKKLDGKYEVQEPPDSHKVHSTSREPKTPILKSADRSLSTHKTKRRSQPYSFPGFDLPESPLDSGDELDFDSKESRFLERNDGDIRSFESGYRELAWNGIREGFQVMLEEGNLQMCAMLSLLAPRELGVSPFDAMRLTESYTDLLSRLRLHSAAAYIRKYSSEQDAKRDSQTQTTIHSACAKCRKAIVKPAATFSRMNGGPRTGFNYCSHCKQSTTKCTICRLPVKAALFMCSVCLHGGHQDCYRRYYLDRPTSRFISSTAATSVQDTNSTNTTSVTREIWGHACAAGCGHICWLSDQ